MKNVKKERLIDSAGINIGFVYELSGKIGYVTETKAFSEFKDIFDKIKVEVASEVVVLDIRKLLRWDTLGLRVVFSVLIETNKRLISKRKPPIGIIGSRDRDTFDAALERHPESNTDLIPWFETLDQFTDKFNL